MEAEKLQWVPDSLYNTSVAAIVATQNTYNRYRRELKTLPEDVQFDIYQGVSYRKRALYANENVLHQLFVDVFATATCVKVIPSNAPW